MFMEKSARLISVLVVLPLLAVIYFMADARYSSFFPRCPFHLVTGLYCPGCGSQRAFSSLLHGQMGQALHYNVLFVLALPFLLYSAGILLINSFTGRHLVQKIFYSTLFVRILLVTVLLFWVCRNIPAEPFSLLSPIAGQ